MMVATLTYNKNMKNKVIIFADGASRGNPGRGGYGAIVISGLEENFNSDSGALHIRELGERDDMTTNNKMELSAVIYGLKYCEKIGISNNADISIYTDSKYVINGSKSWIFGWQKNGWKTASKEEVKNRDLWESMLDLIIDKKINWVLLPGHAGVVGNERCDQIATNLADKEEEKLFDGKLSDYGHSKILDIFYNPDLIKAAKDDKKASGSKKSSSSIKAYSYVSKVDGKINIDKSWTDCEKRVKGKKGALYKKAISIGDQENISKDFMNR